MARGEGGRARRRRAGAHPPEPTTTSVLSAVAVGGRALVVGVDPGPSGVGHRLSDLGFLPGTEVAVVRRAPLGDPTLYELRGYQLCLRRREATLIAVSSPGGHGDRDADGAVAPRDVGGRKP